MLKLKLLFGLCLVTPCILALSCLEPVNVVDNSEPELEAFHQISNEDSGVKINWGPVWEDEDGSNELVSRTGDLDKDKCEAPNGLGLKNFIRQVEKILPKEEIKKILKTYAQDPEIKALEAFIRNPETIEKLKAIEQSTEFQLLKDYSCRILHLDLETYHKIARNLLNPANKRAHNSERKGIRGLLSALDAILPRQEIRELYENLMKTDDELVKAVAHLKSEEFHQLLLNVKNLPENLELRKQLANLGVPVDELHEFFAKSLGWPKGLDTLL